MCNSNIDVIEMIMASSNIINIINNIGNVCISNDIVKLELIFNCVKKAILESNIIMCNVMKMIILIMK